MQSSEAQSYWIPLSSAPYQSVLASEKVLEIQKLSQCRLLSYISVSKLRIDQELFQVPRLLWSPLDGCVRWDFLSVVLLEVTRSIPSRLQRLKDLENS